MNQTFGNHKQTSQLKLVNKGKLTSELSKNGNKMRTMHVKLTQLPTTKIQNIILRNSMEVKL